MYRFARRPKWIALHVFVLVTVSACAVAGVWQLNRLSERRERNDRIRTAMEGPAQEVTDIDDAETFENVRATGTYDVENEVILRNRSLNGSPGNHVLTPLVIDDDLAVIVDRGWVPAELDEAPVAEASPSEGSVTVLGLMLDAEPQRPLTPDDPGSGRLTSVRRINPVRLADQMPYRLLPAYVQLREQDPAQPRPLPRPVPRPELSDGPHLAYAVQWFIFLVIALTVYVALLRREAKRPEREAAPS
jgi:cytochrome oxidase assembly protein ShyY1